MSVPFDEVLFAFQPLVNVRIGGIVAVEALVRPSGTDPEELYRVAERQGGTTELEKHLAVRAVRSFAEHGISLPLHVNLLASTVVRDPATIEVLRDALRQVGRREHEVTIEIGPPVVDVLDDLPTGIAYLRDCGFRVALDHVGAGAVAVELVAELRPDMVKLDRRLLDRCRERKYLAVLDAARHVCESTGVALLVDGVDNEHQLTLLRDHPVPLVQGDLLAPPDRRPPVSVAVTHPRTVVHDPSVPAVESAAAGPRVAEFMSPATALSTEVNAELVRETLVAHPEISSVVLVDTDGRPQLSVNRNRFLLAVTGPYGHALYADKPASRLGDKPQLVTTATTAVEALDLVAQSGLDQFHDDAVVVDEAGRCLGVVPAGALIRGMAELKVEEAAALNPLTRLPGSDSLAPEVGRRIDRGEEFTLNWLDINAFKTVNDMGGFAAGDDLIRSVGRCLTDAATSLTSVRLAHPGGDDFLFVAHPEDLFSLGKRVLDMRHEAGGLLVSLSLATLLCAPASTTSYGEASRRLAPLKRFAKSLAGNGWVLSRPGTDHVEVLRGERRTGSATDKELNQDSDAASQQSETETPANHVAAHNSAQAHSEDAQRLVHLFSLAPAGIGIFDESERLVHANHALCTLLGYPLDDLREMSTEDLAHPQDSADTWRVGQPNSAVTGLAGQSVSQRLLVRSDGQPVHCELHSTLSIQDDRSQFWIVVFQDITQRHQVAEMLRHQATHDSLTGLPNRAAAKQLLRAALNAAQPARVAVLFCDIDNFKRINDSLGHEAGDELLVALARRLEGGLPRGCTPARLPGDEFLISCLDVDSISGGIDSLAITVSSLLRTSLPLHGQLVRVSASVGAAVSTPAGSNVDDLLRFADAALSQAKRRGPGHVSLAGPALMTSADRQLHVEGQLRAALHNDGLTLHYQPMVDQDGTVVAVEALVRWPHPDRGLLPPGEFLPIAEQSDLLGELDRWVLGAALREAAQWREPAGPRVAINVNLGGLMPDGPDFVDEIGDIAGESGIDPYRIVLELVETSAFELSAQARTAMHVLAERGVRFAIDDFGTGYSSLARLKHLPTQIIKTDPQLVSDVASSSSDLAIARAAVDMAHAMGRRCIAEGVETAAQFEALHGLGVDGYQGTLFAKPMPPEQLRAVLETGRLAVPEPRPQGSHDA